MKNKQQIIWYLVFSSLLEVRAKSEIQNVCARATESSFLLPPTLSLSRSSSLPLSPLASRVVVRAEEGMCVCSVHVCMYVCVYMCHTDTLVRGVSGVVCGVLCAGGVCVCVVWCLCVCVLCGLCVCVCGV
jgi:hypothetical protein